MRAAFVFTGCLAAWKQKFSATVTAYQKMPNGSLYGAPLFYSRAHRNGESLRATAQLSSGGGAQRHHYAVVDDVAAFEVYLVASDDDEEEVEIPGTLDAVRCVLPGDAPSAQDVFAATQAAISVDEATMLSVVGPGGCSGDVQRYLGQYSGVDIVVCMTDVFTFQVVSQEFVACTSSGTSNSVCRWSSVGVNTRGRRRRWHWRC